jgi:glycosyltransferase involved in cell wall biosynthesis
MTRIAILSPFIIDADAVSNDVIGMYQALIQRGYEVQVFAADWKISNPKIEHVNQIHLFIGSSYDILIYHYSLKWDVGLNLIQELKCRKIIKYHNITPPEFYEGINADYARVCAGGREQLQSIVDARCHLYLSDSEYNAEELYSKGVAHSKSLVLPPFHQIERLQDIEADLNVLDKYQDGKTNILMVGSLAPNKGHLALIDAFNIYYSIYNRNSRLLIVGKKDEQLINYTTFLYEEVKSLGLLEAVVFTGGVSDEALKAYYLVSHVFMITSEHEGFCVPLVESMAMKLPIVAYGSSAIPYIVGKTGLVWEQPDPYLLAGSVDNIAKNEFISANLGDMGWRRYKEIFANEQIEARFMAALKSLL